jgi:hypothetical protein
MVRAAQDAGLHLVEMTSEPRSVLPAGIDCISSPDQDRPVRGRNHPMMMSCGARRLRGKLYRWTAAFAKASACGPDCRFWCASDIHSRMMARRTFTLAILYFLSRSVLDDLPATPRAVR